MILKIIKCIRFQCHVLIYIKYCIRSTFTGMFTHVFTLGSPFCQFINYMQFELSRYYITIWAAAAIGLITWFVTKAK